MLNIIRSYLDFYRDTRGLTIVEYAVAGALITAAVVVAFTLLGTNIGAEINGLADDVSGP
ncbi:MAG: Flp family type IVb pilin [Pseudomonadota bacterium]